MILSILSIILGSMVFIYALQSPRPHFHRTNPDKMHKYFSFLLFTPFGFLFVLGISTVVLGIITLFYQFSYYWLVLLILLFVDLCLYNWELYICGK